MKLLRLASLLKNNSLLNRSYAAIRTKPPDFHLALKSVLCHISAKNVRWFSYPER